jgi:acyl-CoA dehydrogenase
MGLDFEFSPQQRLFRRSVRAFLDAEIRPNLPLDSPTGHGEFPKENVRKMGAAGMFAPAFPREYGGAGMGEIGACIAEEEMGRLDSSHATILGAHVAIGAAPIWLFGTPAQRERFLPDLASGRKLAAFALTEPKAGSDAASISTQADRKGQSYVLNGSKLWCTNGDQADVLVVMAVTDKALGAKGGVTAFIVEKDTPGFQIGTIEDKMGIRNSSTAELVFEECKVPAENVLGQVGAGFIVALTALDGGRTGLAAGVLGASKELLASSLEYATSRTRRGRPLSEEQAVQWRLADMAAEIRTADYIIYHTAKLVGDYYDRIAEGKPVPEALRERVAMNAATIKVFASEMGGRIVESTMEIMGASSVLDRNRVERIWRDQIITEIFEGTSEVQRLIIARELVRLGGLGE